jgi:branched-chain amino acid transport system permease protein
LGTPQTIYFVAIASALLIAFVAWRLRESRLGRAWMAIREDEDVAEALGVNLIQTKLLAYMLGAAFAGLGGAIFATRSVPSCASMVLTVSSTLSHRWRHERPVRSWRHGLDRPARTPSRGFEFRLL